MLHAFVVAIARSAIVLQLLAAVWLLPLLQFTLMRDSAKETMKGRRRNRRRRRGGGGGGGGATVYVPQCFLSAPSYPNA
eukprot:9303848-Pyramimonas_sp.AAC.1